VRVVDERQPFADRHRQQSSGQHRGGSCVGKVAQDSIKIPTYRFVEITLAPKATKQISSIRNGFAGFWSDGGRASLDPLGNVVWRGVVDHQRSGLGSMDWTQKRTVAQCL
jgi:hypothetical protein